MVKGKRLVEFSCDCLRRILPFGGRGSMEEALGVLTSRVEEVRDKFIWDYSLPSSSEQLCTDYSCRLPMVCMLQTIENPVAVAGGDTITFLPPQSRQRVSAFVTV